MTPLLPLLTALLPAVQAAPQDVPTPWYPGAADSCRQTAEGLRGMGEGVDAALAGLGGAQAPESATPSGNPAEGEQEGDSIATCEGGLFFDTSDTKRVRLVYLDRVKLRDARIHLDAAHRLYLQIQRNEAEAEAKNTGKGSAPAGQESPGESEAGSKAPAGADTPIAITAYDAMVDTAGNRIFLTSGPGEEELLLEQGDNRLAIRSAAGKPACLLADEAGNVLMEGAHIALRWVDGKGRPGTLDCDGGRAFYHGESHCLVMEGPVRLEQAPGSLLEAEGRLCVSFRMAEGTEAARSNAFMGQFSALRVEGVAAASTEVGKRVLLRDSERRLSLQGNALRYDGIAGEAEVAGAPCTLGYGANSLQTQGRIRLEEDGSIALVGEDIRGTYERPSQAKEGGMVRGSMSAQGELRFHAGSGTITTRALCARDAEADFSCTGPVELTLTPLPQDKQHALPPREKTGMLNLAIARYGDIATARASGSVRAHGFAPGSADKPLSALSASALEADLLEGSMLLTGSGEAASLTYEGYALSGTAAAGGEARLQLQPNGDIGIRGEWIEAAIPGKRGLTTLRCAERATLRRENRELELGPSSRIEAPEGILTANGPLTARLAPSDKPARPASPRYPHLSYNFGGLESASTAEGATVRTEQGSLQCAQELSISMEQDLGKKNEMGGISHATATGKVAVAARDNQGRLMRAMGDRLMVDGRTGEKLLTGSTVVLEDESNRHTASGGNASVRLDARNNARISGAKHETTARGIRRQVDEQKFQKQKKR